MLFQAPSLSIYIRIVSILALLLGLNDAARLLGVSLGASSPITTMGFTAFVYLGIFSLARLFAAVGLWIKASWGAVLLIGASTAELLLYLTGSPDIRMSVASIVMRTVLLAGMVLIFGLAIRNHRAEAD